MFCIKFKFTDILNFMEENVWNNIEFMDSRMDSVNIIIKVKVLKLIINK